MKKIALSICFLLITTTCYSQTFEHTKRLGVAEVDDTDLNYPYKILFDKGLVSSSGGVASVSILNLGGASSQVLSTDGERLWFKDDATGGSGSTSHLHPQYTPLTDYSVHLHPDYTARIDNIHPEYTPLSDYSTHIHSAYVPYTGATSTVNLGSQHVATSGGIEAGNVIVGKGGDIRPSANSTTAINIAQADGTDWVKFDTTNKKIAFNGNPNNATYALNYTTGVSGIAIFGSSSADSYMPYIDGNWYLTADGAAGFIFRKYSAGYTTLGVLTTDSLFGVGTASPDRRIHSETDDATTNATTQGLRLTHTTSGTPAANIGAGQEFEVETSAGNNEVVATIEGIATAVGAGTEAGALVFKTMTSGAATTEKVRIDTDGNVGVGTTTPGYKLDVNGTLNCGVLTSNHQHPEYSSGGGGGGYTFQTLASPQALQGVEQLRHVLSSYQNYGNVIVDGFVDQTGVSQKTDLSFTGASTYEYALSPGEPAGTLLIHFNGADGATSYTTEDTGARTVTFAGTAQLDTAQQKFGTASLLLDGNSDSITVPDSADWTFGTGDFTIDCWVRFNDMTGSQIIVGQLADANNRYQFYKDSTHHLYFYARIGSVDKADFVTTDVPAINVNEWHHIELVRSGSSAFIFLDGTSLALTTTVSFGANDLTDISAALTSGFYSPGSSNYFNGWIDEMHIIKGTASHTSNFTAPTSEYGGDAATSGYLHTISHPLPNVPTHMGVSVKMDSTFTSDQHTYLKLDVSRDGGTTFTDCHPITKIGESGYYRGAMTGVTSQPSGSNAVTKISLGGSTARTLRGYGVYAE